MSRLQGVTTAHAPLSQYPARLSLNVTSIHHIQPHWVEGTTAFYQLSAHPVSQLQTPRGEVPEQRARSL